MMKRILSYLMMSGAVLWAAPSHLSAQDSLLLRDYQYIKQADPWLTSVNASALTRYQRQSVAEATVYVQHHNGGLIDFSESPRVLQAGANVESFYRIGRRTVVFGNMSYDNYTGRDMGGSAFMHLGADHSLLASHYPFDIVEDSLTNTGKKHRDLFHLAGGVGVDIWKGYALGARIDYTAANYAKYKDLRHRNKLMDLQVTVGGYAPLLPWLNIGADYVYHRNTESVYFSTYGSNDKVFKSLIDYAAFTGRVEQFGEEGYTDSNMEIPLFSDSHGANIQIEAILPAELTLYNEVSLSTVNGYYGRKSPNTITFTNHHSSRFGYRGQLALHQTQHLHQLTVTVSREKMENNRTTYRSERTENNASYYQYFDDVRTGDKKWTDVSIGYTGHLNIRHELPQWTVKAMLELNHRKLTANLHPYFRTQKLNVSKWLCSATRHLPLAKGMLAATLQLTFQKGSGDAYSDGVYETPSDKQATPPSMDAYLYREYQYQTAAQYGVGASVKYSFVFPQTRLNTFVQADVNYKRANSNYDSLTGRNRVALAIAVGCLF